MKIESKLKKFWEYLDGADSVALLCHVNPDSDTLGSALALKLILEKTGKTVAVFCDDSVPERLSFLPYSAVVNAEKAIVKFDAAVAVDCADAGRFNISGRYFKKAKVRLVIDHHNTNDNFADFTVCQPDYAATAELIYAFACFLEKETGKEILDINAAILIFAGIVGDTGAFQFSNTTTRTFEIAAQLTARFNIDSHQIIYRLIKSRTAERYMLKARALNATKFYFDNRVGIMTFTRKDFAETGTTCDCTEGIITDLVDVDGVQIAIAVSEMQEKCFKVSIRTKAPINAAAVASAFGGGGHERAAGCRLSGYYEDVVEKLLKSARDNLND